MREIGKGFNAITFLGLWIYTRLWILNHSTICGTMYHQLIHLADACRKNITNELIHVESDSVESKIADITV